MRRILKIAALICMTSVVLLIVFYWRYEQYALSLVTEKSIPDEKANAIKHAVAAAEVYQAIAAVAGDARAESYVLFLGNLNEYLEQTIRIDSLDVPAELFKDMVNNQIGITAAQWQHRTAPTGDLRQTILSLAQANILITSSQSMTLSTSLEGLKGYDSIHEVSRLFEEMRPKIIAQTLEKLSKTAP